jgi:hypothetical protein
MNPDIQKRPRLTREARIVGMMIGMYCRANHRSKMLCGECQPLKDYALDRLDKCPFGEDKTVCSICSVHCYKAEMRQKIRVVMQYAGPRMMAHHPIMAVRHLLDKRRNMPSVV